MEGWKGSVATPAWTLGSKSTRSRGTAGDLEFPACSGQIDDIMEIMQKPEIATAEPVKCACPSCHCMVPPDRGVQHEGKMYCSKACAYDCTETTCVCVHDRCEGKH